MDGLKVKGRPDHAEHIHIGDRDFNIESSIAHVAPVSDIDRVVTGPAYWNVSYGLTWGERFLEYGNLSPYEFIYQLYADPINGWRAFPA